MIKYLLLLALPIISFNSFSQTIYDNLLIHYKFDGDADDYSGNSYQGSVNATLTTDRNGTPNKAYHFDGVSEFINFPNVSALKPQLPLSYSFWAKLDDINATKTVFVANCFSQDNHAGVWMNGSGAGKLAINYGSATGTTGNDNLRNKVGTTILQTGVWYHFVGICRSETDMELYINCINDQGTYAGAGGELGYTSDAGNIGRKDVSGQSPYHFKGSMDEFMYWDRAISLSEIDILCTGTLSLNENDFSHLSIYPTPTNSVLNVKNHLDKFENYKIYNVTGQVISEGKFSEEINVSEMSTGVYILELSSDSKSFKKQFIKY
jgi:hypothetical protein